MGRGGLECYEEGIFFSPTLPWRGRGQISMRSRESDWGRLVRDKI